jgi:4-amino-4-deoxychorismate lyase
MLGGVKSTSYAVNMAAEAEARRRGADDAIFLASGKIVLEGPVTNVWWRRGATLFTPSVDLGILPGVTRQTLLEEAARLGYEVREGAFPLDDLTGSEEAFTSSSVREVVPIVSVDDLPIAYGRPGPAAIELQGALRARAGGR